MSYARSPRPVCSITIGTSIIFGSFKFTCHTPAPTANSLAREDRKWSALRGLVIQQVEGLLGADSVPNPIQRPIACQSSPHRFRSLFCLRCERLDLVIDFFLADVNLLQIGDLVEQQCCLDLLYRLVPLPDAETVQVHLLHVF